MRIVVNNNNNNVRGSFNHDSLIGIISITSFNFYK